METAIYSTIGLLFVAALSGLSYLAAKHPSTYASVAEPFTLGTIGIGLISFAFSWGVRYATFVAIHPFIAPGKIQGAKAVADQIDSVCALISFASLGLLGFFGLLAKIGFHIRDQEHRDDNRRERK